jgi:argininosuccinate lyase
MAKLWGERFKKGLDQAAERFSYSLPVDYVLAGSDIKASMAHALMLGKVGLIGEAEAKRLVRGLWSVLALLKRRKASDWQAEDGEDIHTLIQNLLEKKLGPLARKLHTARSRNDLVATSVRLYLRDEILAVMEKILAFQRSLVSFAERTKGIFIPGYTHMQRAQIVLLGHHVLAYAEMLWRDYGRFREARERMNECPLGAGALAGSSLALDRGYVAKLLGFRRPCANSIDAVSDRDFVVEAVADAAMLMMHVSRFAEDTILWCSSEFGYVSLSDAFSTGSSLMPHKKNPDML